MTVLWPGCSIAFEQPPSVARARVLGGKIDPPFSIAYHKFGILLQ